MLSLCKTNSVNYSDSATITSNRFKKYSLFSLYDYLPKKFILFEVKKIQNKKISKLILNHLKIYKLPINKIMQISDFKDAIRCVCFSPNGKYLGAGCWDNTATIYKIINCTNINPIPLIKFISHTNSIFSVDFSHSGKYFATASNDKTANIHYIMDFEDRLLENENIDKSSNNPAIISEHTKAVLSVNFCPLNSTSINKNVEYIATSSEDITILVNEISHVDSQFTIKLVHKLDYHKDYISSIRFSPSGYFLASGSDDSSSIIYNLETKTTVAILIFNSDILSVSFSPFEDNYAVACKKSAYLYKIDLLNGKSDNLVKLKNHTGHINSISFSATGDYLATASDDRQIFIYWTKKNDKNFGKLISHLHEHSSYIVSISFSSCGRFFASGGVDKKIVIYK